MYARGRFFFRTGRQSVPGHCKKRIILKWAVCSIRLKTITFNDNIGPMSYKRTSRVCLLCCAKIEVERQVFFCFLENFAGVCRLCVSSDNTLWSRQRNSVYNETGNKLSNQSYTHFVFNYQV